MGVDAGDVGGVGGGGGVCGAFGGDFGEDGGGGAFGARNAVRGDHTDSGYDRGVDRDFVLEGGATRVAMGEGVRPSYSK